MRDVERWVSMEEICKHLGASRDTVKKMIKTQKEVFSNGARSS